MKKLVFAILFGCSALLATNFAQVPGSRPANEPLPDPAASPTPKLSAALRNNLERQDVPVSRERREEAYVKLLEGQRHLWGAQRVRSQYASDNAINLAKQSFQEAAKLNPRLAEAYTGLAELTRDGEEAVTIARIAIKLNPDNFGAHRILARIFTIQSRLGEGQFNASAAEKALEEWKEVTRLDPRNAEGWAFQSALYEKLGRSDGQIEALYKWLASAAPVDTFFYRRVMGREENLSPEAAALKLGAVLLEAGRTKEAVEILSRAVADDPENVLAIDLLRESLTSADAQTSALARQAIQQAIYTNPENVSLVLLMAQTEARSGSVENAAKILRDEIDNITPTNRNAAAELQYALGEIYADADRDDEAVAVLQNALRIRGIEDNNLVTDEDREFAARVYDKTVQIYKNAGRTAEARKVIENARPLFGRNDLFADRQLIRLFRESGNRAEALKAVRAARAGFPDDISLLRTEAEILTESGRVQEGVSLIRSLMDKNKISTIPSPANDSFSNFLFISTLYAQAKRGPEAIEAAELALAAAQGEEQKQIAKLVLATAQQTMGDYAGAEKTLRDILAKSPGNPIALNNLGYFLLERDVKIQEAFDLIQRAVNVDPTNPSYLDSLGWAYFKLGKFTEAEKYLKSAARFDAASATIREHLGDVYQKQGKIELARTAWRKALDLASDSEDINRIKNKLK